MPIKLPNHFPATDHLVKEGIDAMPYERAQSQDIRPLKFLIFNLMPKKIDTEVQLLRLIGNTSLQIEVEFLRTATHSSKNTASSHLDQFYVNFDDIKDKRYDAMIVTGAPVEQLDYTDVDYWKELEDVIEWSEKSVFTTMFICWGAQAALYHIYGVAKVQFEQKLFGVYEDKILRPCFLFDGFDDVHYCPQSRWTGLDETALEAAGLHTISGSDFGSNIIETKGHRRIFVLGHFEYDRETLDAEYQRDVQSDKPIELPVNYYPNDDPTQTPTMLWRAHANLFWRNWINFIYQETPFDLRNL